MTKVHRPSAGFVVCLLLILFAANACTANALDVDIAQQRLDTATPPLDGLHTAQQSFICRLPNLCQIEILPAVYSEPGHGALILSLQANSDARTELARWSVDPAYVRHNAPLVFAFPQQRDSAGQNYQLIIEGAPGVQVGLWYSSVDSYGSGGLALDGTATAGDLYFLTRCSYGPLDATRTLAAGALRSGWLLVPLALLVFLPGCLVAHGLHLLPGSDRIADWALSIGMSLALVPVALLWSTVFGLRWRPGASLAAFVGLVLLALAREIRAKGRHNKPQPKAGYDATSAAAAALLTLTLTVRFLQIRGLVLPAWVDSPQHVLVTQLIAMLGQVPRSFEPLLPISGFVYHYGFHADVALFHWLAGLDIPGAMLVLGQALNAAAALTAYLLALRLTGRRLAAVAALWVVGLISWMPAYYVSWGRYTQLAGLVVVPAALVVSLDWLQGEVRDYRRLAAAALLQSGAFMTHSRVTVYGACLLLAFWLCESILRVWKGHAGEALELAQRIGMITVVTAGVSGPWVLQVVGGMVAALRASGTTSLAADPMYNAVPAALLWAPGNRELMAVAGIGAALGLLRRTKSTLWTLVWVVLVALLLNPGWLGLRATALLNNATAIIALFLPLSVLCGQAVACLWDSLRPSWASAAIRVSSHGMAAVVRVVLAGAVVFAALVCAWRMISIVNPVTVLATAEDLEAMDWIRLNTAPDAVFLINARSWQLGVYAGTDGGYWIPQLTGRATLLPALSYTYGPPQYTQHIREVAEVVSQVSDADDPRLLAVMERDGVTHVYIGAKGGGLKAQMFLKSTRYQVAYSNGAVWVFAFVDDTKKRALLLP